MLTDDDFPVLDVDISSEDIEERIGATDMTDNVVRAPPSSGDSEFESDGNLGEKEYISDYGNEMQNKTVVKKGADEDPYTGKDAFGTDAYEEKNYLEPEPSIVFPVNLLLHETDFSSRNSANNMTDLETAAIPQSLDILAHLLRSTLMCQPLKLKCGYTPDELDLVLQENMGFCLQYVTEVYLGEDAIKNLPNKSKTEYALALTRAKWLTHKDGRFFPDISEEHREMVTCIIAGAERLSRFEENMKKAAHEFETEEQEIRALRTFNMIAELLHHVRNEHETRRIQYQLLARGYELMVTGRLHKGIYDKYKKWLPLEPDKLWNSKWFLEYTKRSTLKKFLTGSRFSEIVVAYKNNLLLYFRADDEGDRPVRLFTEADMKDVREKWQIRNQKFNNARSRWNCNRGGDQGGAPLPHRKRGEQDSNFRPATLSLECSSDVDDSSVRPTTLCRNEGNDHPAAFTKRISQSPSPVRQENNTTTQPVVCVPDAVIVPKLSAMNPSTGHGSSPIGGHSKNDMKNKRSIARVRDVGETSSDGEDLSSDGSYSNEEADVKEARHAKKTERMRKNEEKEKLKRHKHACAANLQNKFRSNRFHRYVRRSASPKHREIERTSMHSSKSTTTFNVSSPAKSSPAPQPETERQAELVSVQVVGPALNTPAPDKPAVFLPNALGSCISSSNNAQEHCKPCEPTVVRNHEGVKEKERQELNGIRLVEQTSTLSTENSCVSSHSTAVIQHPYLIIPNNAPTQSGTFQKPQFPVPIARNGFRKNPNTQTPEPQPAEYCRINSQLAAASTTTNYYSQGQAPAPLHRSQQSFQPMQNPSPIFPAQEQQYNAEHQFQAQQCNNRHQPESQHNTIEQIPVHQQHYFTNNRYPTFTPSPEPGPPSYPSSYQNRDLSPHFMQIEYRPCGPHGPTIHQQQQLPLSCMQHLEPASRNYREATYQPYYPCGPSIPYNAHQQQRGALMSGYQHSLQYNTARKSASPLCMLSHYNENVVPEVNNEQIICQILAIMYECKHNNCIVTQSVLINKMQQRAALPDNFNVGEFIKHRMLNVIRVIDRHPEPIFFLSSEEGCGGDSILI